MPAKQAVKAIAQADFKILERYVQGLGEGLVMSIEFESTLQVLVCGPKVRGQALGRQEVDEFALAIGHILTYPDRAVPGVSSASGMSPGSFFC